MLERIANIEEEVKRIKLNFQYCWVDHTHKPESSPFCSYSLSNNFDLQRQTNTIDSIRIRKFINRAPPCSACWTLKTLGSVHEIWIICRSGPSSSYTRTTTSISERFLALQVAQAVVPELINLPIEMHLFSWLQWNRDSPCSVIFCAKKLWL